MMIEMRMRRWLGVVALCTAAGWGGDTAFAMGKASPVSAGPEVLVVPARWRVVQVGFDVINRAGAVLVAYQGDATTEAPGLHVWNGVAWIPISPADFGSGSYLSTPPGRIVLVGDDATLPPRLVETATGVSAAEVLGVPTQETADLLNALGQVYRFSPEDWSWYAARYGLDLSDANEELRQISFYDQPIVGRPTWPWSRERPAPARLGAREDGAPVIDEEDLPDISAEPAAAEVEMPPPAEWEERAVADDAPVK